VVRVIACSLCNYSFLIKPDWLEILKVTLIPKITWSTDYIMTLVGFLGTTISPYLFFWQTSQEVEEEISDTKSQITDFGQKPVVIMYMIKKMRFDTKVGMLFSNVMTFFIVVTTAGTLHASGIFEISSAEQAA
jgi:Mn2+/Fe2+ NRAMP family transporter